MPQQLPIQAPPRKERRRVDPQVIGQAHALGYGRDSASIDEILRGAEPTRRAELLTLLAGGAIS